MVKSKFGVSAQKSGSSAMTSGAQGGLSIKEWDELLRSPVRVIISGGGKNLHGEGAISVIETLGKHVLLAWERSKDLAMIPTCTSGNIIIQSSE